MDMNEIDPSAAKFETPADHRAGFVAVIGRPNVGKSTLMNAFLGEKVAIVSPRPQTTRTRQLGILTSEKYQIIFMDTPGIMQPRHKLDEYMLEMAVDSLNDADLILWLVDASEPIGAGDRAIATQLIALENEVPIILAMNKSDLLLPEQVLPRSADYNGLLPEADWLLFSAKIGLGRAELLQRIVNKLPLGPRFYPPDQVTDVYLRDIAAEFIREQVMLQLRDELPYSIAVQVTDFKERENGTTYIGANIFVERENHKRIVIGAKGSQLKAIGSAARQEIATLVEGNIYLELWVKVAPKWRRNEKTLRRLGYHKID